MSSGTVGSSINVNGQTIVLSFGRGADGKNVLIVTPGPGTSGNLNFNLVDAGNTRMVIQNTPQSTVTARVNQNGRVDSVSSGLMGQVSVNGRPLNPGQTMNLQTQQIANNQNNNNNNGQQNQNPVGNQQNPLMMVPLIWMGNPNPNQDPFGNQENQLYTFSSFSGIFPGYGFNNPVSYITTVIQNGQISNDTGLMTPFL